MSTRRALSTRVVPLDAICHFVHANGGGERAAAWVAAQQLELITAAQLRTAEVGRGVIATRRRKGTLHPVHTGVYLLGTSIMLPGAPELAAVLACHDGACVRRRSAAARFGLAGPWDGGVEVVVPGRNCRSRPGIAVERVAVLAASDRCVHDGIPVTAPARTILDLAAIAAGDELERAIAEAYALKLVTERELRAVVQRNPSRAGVAALRAELDRTGGPQWTQSKAERLMKLLLRKAGLPIPLTRQKVAGFKTDFLWPEHRLIVETDGHQFHRHRYAFEHDRRRDQAHIAAGYRVLRFTWRQLQEEPFRVVATIAMALGGG